MYVYVCIKDVKYPQRPAAVTITPATNNKWNILCLLRKLHESRAIDFLRFVATPKGQRPIPRKNRPFLICRMPLVSDFKLMVYVCCASVRVIPIRLSVMRRGSENSD